MEKQEGCDQAEKEKCIKCPAFLICKKVNNEIAKMSLRDRAAASAELANGLKIEVEPDTIIATAIVNLRNHMSFFKHREDDMIKIEIILTQTVYEALRGWAELVCYYGKEMKDEGVPKNPETLLSCCFNDFLVMMAKGAKVQNVPKKLMELLEIVSKNSP